MQQSPLGWIVVIHCMWAYPWPRNADWFRMRQQGFLQGPSTQHKSMHWLPVKPRSTSRFWDWPLRPLMVRNTHTFRGTSPDISPKYCCTLLIKICWWSLSQEMSSFPQPEPGHSLTYLQPDGTLCWITFVPCRICYSSAKMFLQALGGGQQQFQYDTSIPCPLPHGDSSAASRFMLSVGV